MAENPNKFLHARQASEYLEEEWRLRRAEKTLAKLRCLGGGPEFHKAGRDVLYTPAALDAYALSIISKPLTSTSDLAADLLAESAARSRAVADLAEANEIPADKAHCYEARDAR